jgi:cytochrome c-type biogenesis protein CcmE
MKKAYIIAFLVIGIATGFTMWAFSSAMTPYVDIKTARSSTTPVQVKGKILHETVRWENNALRFKIEDKNHDQIEIVYRGPKPDAFDTAPETAADGVIHREADGQEIFESNRMVVKCPSKYDDSKKAAPQNAATHNGV